MERNDDLITAILKWRRGEQESGGIAPPDLPDWTRDQVCYHAELCQQAGFLQSYTHTMSGDGTPVRLQCRIGPLTWKGHEELDRRIRR